MFVVLFFLMLAMLVLVCFVIGVVALAVVRSVDARVTVVVVK